MSKKIKELVCPIILIINCIVVSVGFFIVTNNITANTTKEHITDTVTIETQPPIPIKKTTYIDLGQYRLTVYTPESDGGKWGYQTATGRRSEHLTTCAVDPTVIPYGTVITIGEEDGLKLQAVDCGSSVKGYHIDIFYDGTEKEAFGWLMSTFGDYAHVYIEKGGEQ